MNPDKVISNKKRKQFFLIATMIFLVWMTFFDSADFFTLYKLVSKYIKLNSEQKYYIENIKKLENYKKAISTKEILEKIAREKYFMKKPNEDIYIIK